MLIVPGKIPLRVHPFFFLLIILIGWLNSQTIWGTAVWMGVIFVSVIVHELGHALTAVAFGQHAEIELAALGGTTYRGGLRIKPWQNFLVVLNGPLAGLLLLCFVYYLRLNVQGQPITLFTYAIQVAFFVNLFWTAINLLPIQPLDGGHLFLIFLEGLFGLRGTKFAYFFSFFLAAAAGTYFFIIGAMLIGSLLLLFAFNSFRFWKSLLVVREQDQDHVLQEAFMEAEKKMHLGEFDEAYQQFQDIRERTKEGVIFLAATENVAAIDGQHDKFQEVYDLLRPYEKNLSPEGFFLLHQSAYQMGDWKEAVAIGDRLFRSHPSYDTAMINALSHAMLGHVKPAVGWLQSAIHEGLPNLDQVLSMSEFDAIRGSSPFQKFVTEVSDVK